jgi:hypothetical protein
MKTHTLAECMDIFDWFDDPTYEYIQHILLAKLDGEARVARALRMLCEQADELIASHREKEEAYPEELLNQPA